MEWLPNAINSQQSHKELNKVGKCKENISNVVDDVYGASNIAEHFKNVYEQLYNEQSDNIGDIEILINNNISNDDGKANEFVKSFNMDLVKRAIHK